MHRYFVQLAYKGTNYHGWQIQPNAITVQEVLNESFQTFFRNPSINLVGCGRTDTGVHASDFYAHFETEEQIPLENAVFRLNNMLPKDIVLFNLFEVKPDQHTRFDATSRTYQYHIHLKKNPFILETSHYMFQKLNVEAMNEACKVLFNHEDFTSFSKLHTDTKTNNCTIMLAKWEESDHGLVFTVKANRFLRNMVRAIVGTMLEVGLGKITVAQFNEVILKKDRGAAGASVPGKGLFLTKIEYPYL